MTTEPVTISGEELYQRIVEAIADSIGDEDGTFDAREFLLFYAELLGDFMALFIESEPHRLLILKQFNSTMTAWAMKQEEGGTIQ